jgi:ABC-type uncharacterized transport system permease subunit
MFETSAIWIRVAAALYSVGLLHAILIVLRRKARVFPFALAAFSVAAVLHMVSLVEKTLALRTLPLNNFYDSASLCAFLIALLFLFVYWRYRIESLSCFCSPWCS